MHHEPTGGQQRPHAMPRAGTFRGGVAPEPHTCAWDDEGRVCGDVAPYEVLIKTRTSHVRAWLCEQHKRERNTAAAKARRTDRHKETRA